MRSFKVWSKIEICAKNRNFEEKKQFVQKYLNNRNFGQKNKKIEILKHQNCFQTNVCQKTTFMF